MINKKAKYIVTGSIFIFVKERQTNFRDELFESLLAMILGYLHVQRMCYHDGNLQSVCANCYSNNSTRGKMTYTECANY